MVKYNVFCSSISKLMRGPRKRTINGSLLCEIRLDTAAIEIYKFFQGIFPILFLMKIIILTQMFRTISGHAVNFVVKIQRPSIMEQKLHRN